MKNVIVLSCSTGQGHNSCAEAIRESFEERGVRCEVREALDFVSPWLTRAVSWGHSFMYKHIPWLFRWGYHLSEVHPGMLEKSSFIVTVLRRGARRLGATLAAGGYDSVICTHMFAALELTEVLETRPLPVKTAFVATDYTLCPGTEVCGTESIFIPCESLTGAYRERMRPWQRCAATGIPVRESFCSEIRKEEARRSLNIGAGNRHLLVMCGSMGCGPIVKLLRYLVSEMPENLEVTVICGTNDRLREKLERAYRGNGRVHIVGYTDRVAEYMDAADLYLTKPGGISVTEAAARHLPMAFIDAVSGCEKYNMDFFTGLGAAVTDPSVRVLAGKCLKLLASDERLERMRAALREYGQANGAELIYRELTERSEP